MKSLAHTVCLLSLSLPLAAHALTDDEPLPIAPSLPEKQVISLVQEA